MQQFGTTNIGMAIIFAVILAGALAFVLFPNQVIDWLRWLDRPSDGEIKKQSDLMLAEMDHNIAERKSSLKKGDLERWFSLPVLAF